MKSFIILKNFVRDHKRQYIIGLFFLIGVNSLQLIIPKIMGTFADSISEQRVTQSDILKFIFIILGLALLIAFSRFIWRINIMGNARRLEYSLRNTLFGHLQILSTNFFNTHKTGELMAHATNDINAIRRALGSGIVFAVDALFMTGILLFMMAGTISLRLTLVALIPLPFLTVITLGFGRVINRRFRKVQEAFASMTDRVQENFSGIRVVKAFAQEEEEKEKFRAVNQHNVDMNMHLVKLQGFFWPLIQYISSLSFVIGLGYGGILVIRGEISLGDFIAFNSYLGMLTWPIMALGWMINMIQRGRASLDRINTILVETPEIKDDSNVIPIDKINGKIEFRNLNFIYPGTDVEILKNINLTIPAGKTVGILGRTGSGKTTLVNLLLRLYNPPRNTIFIDDTDIRQIPLETLRTNIGYVPQDNFLFSTTIEENIDFAWTEQPLPVIQKHAAVAQVHDNIIDFPYQYDTMVGERGVTLSGGQKQRISIARALIKEPSILILDDSLSAVDTETEEAILNNLTEIFGKSTSIFIAHRISTLKTADIIIVLENGTISQKGTHEELIEQEGLYRELYEKQLLEEKIEEAI